MSRLDFTRFGQPYTSDIADVQDLLIPRRTTAQLASATDEINTEDKFLGRMVWDSTLSVPKFASGAAAADPWYTAAELATPFTATSAELADAADPINTVNKRTGKMVFDTTTSLPAFAVGGDATSVWASADITVGVDITPS